MDTRAAKIAALIEHGATAGERAAARAAAFRVQQAELAARAELERSVGFGWNPARFEAEAAEHAATMDRLDLEGLEHGEAEL